MSLKNTSYNYGTIAKCLHWGTALLLLGAYASVYFRHWFTVDDTPANWTALQLHLSFSVSIAVLVVLRIIWRIMNRTPDEEPGTSRSPCWTFRFICSLDHYASYRLFRF